MRTVRGRVIGACKLPSPHALLHAPKLKTFLASIPPTPSIVNWSAPALSVIQNIEGNDNYGDCVLAEDAHYIGVLTGNANALYSYTRAQTLADYTAMTGFNPAVPSSDQGTDPIAAMNYRVANGYADGSKDAGWAMVDATNQAEVRYALAEFGNLKMWFGVPDSIVNAIPLRSGFVWDVTAGPPDQNNGHCIGSCGYNPTIILVVAVTAQGLLVMTWGMLGIVTWAAVAAWFVPNAGGGMATRVSMDWVNTKSGKAPSGLDAAGMISTFNTYFGGGLVVPNAPPPAPPTGPASLANAQAWAAAGVNAGADALMTKAQAVAAANTGLQQYWPAAAS